MSFYSRTGLGRALEPRHPNTQRVVSGGIAAGAIALAITVARDGFDLRPAVLAGIATFLAWAIAREIDPDRLVTAHVAMALTLGAVLINDSFSIGAIAFVLLAARIAAGTVGRPLTTIDGVALILWASFAGPNPAAWPAALALIVVTARTRSLSAWFPAAMAIVATITGLAAGTEPTVQSALPALLVIPFGFVPVERVTTCPDSGLGRIRARDVGRARLLAMASVATGSWLSADGIWTFSPAVAVLLAAALVWPFTRSRAKVDADTDRLADVLELRPRAAS